MKQARRRFARERERECDREQEQAAARHPDTGELEEPEDASFLDELHSDLAELAALGVHTTVDRDIGSLRRKGLTISARRRRGPLTDADPLQSSPTVSLVEDERGVLRLALESPALEPAGASTLLRLKRARRTALRDDASVAAAPEPGLGAEVLTDLFFDPFPPNQLGEVLRTFDRWRAPERGLRRVVSTSDGYKTEGLDAALKAERLLVIVHGTASSGQHIVNELATSAEGRNWLASMCADANRPLVVFDHATLSVSPVLNALDLAADLARLAPDASQIDVVCHSRGGLVARWWAEAAERRPRRVGRVIFVGSPLDGTSLAAPSALKGFIEATANTARAIHKTSQVAGTLVPQLSVLTSLVGILSRVYSVVAGTVAKTPLADVALAAVPGLLAMSRVDHNEESARLLTTMHAPSDAWTGSRYRFVASDFEPENPGWRVWRYLTDGPLVRTFDAAADRLFPGPNDLVVDTQSMNVIRRPESGGLRTIRKTCGDVLPAELRVHHLNYFQQPRVIDDLQRWLA